MFSSQRSQKHTLMPLTPAPYRFSPLPKSDSHQAENADVYDFELSEDQMKAIDELDEGEKGAVAPHNPNCP